MHIAHSRTRIHTNIRYKIMLFTRGTDKKPTDKTPRQISVDKNLRN